MTAKLRGSDQNEFCYYHLGIIFKWFIPVVCENIIMNINDIR